MGFLAGYIGPVENPKNRNLCRVWMTGAPLIEPQKTKVVYQKNGY